MKRRFHMARCPRIALSIRAASFLASTFSSMMASVASDIRPITSPSSLRRAEPCPGRCGLGRRDNTVGFGIGFFFRFLNNLTRPVFGHRNNIVGFGAASCRALPIYVPTRRVLFAFVGPDEPPIDCFAPVRAANGQSA